MPHTSRNLEDPRRVKWDASHEPKEKICIMNTHVQTVRHRGGHRQASGHAVGNGRQASRKQASRQAGRRMARGKHA